MKTISILFFLLFLIISTSSLFSQDLQFSEKPLICKGHRTTVNEVVFSPDGKILATCGGANQIILFNSENGAILLSSNKNPMGSPINYISINYDGTLLITGGYNNKDLQILSMNKLALKTNINNYKYVDDLCFSPINNTFAVIGILKDSEKHVISLYDADSGNKIKQLYKQDSEQSLPTCIAFSPDGQYLACGVTNSIYIYNINNGEKIKVISHNNTITALDYSPDGQYIAGGDIKDVNIWNVNSGKLSKTLYGLSNYILTVDYSPNGQYIVAAGMDHKCKFKMWNTSTGALVQSIDQKGPDINSLCFSPDGKSLAMGLRTYGDLFEVTTACIYKTHSAILNQEWYNVNSSAAKLILDFPVKPEEEMKKDQYYAYYDYSLSHSGFVYQVRATKYLYSINESKRTEAINKKAVTYKKDKTNVSQSTFIVNGKQGIDLVGYKNDIRYHYRFIFINDVMYYILIISHNDSESPEETKFFNSFDVY